MRTLITVCLAVSVTLLSLSGAAASAAEWAPGKYMTQAIDQMLLAYCLVPDREDVGFDDGGISLAGAYLDQGSTYSMLRSLEANRKYILVGGGDLDTTDVDVSILDANGQVIASDTRVDRMALVEFSPAKSGKYEIRLRLYKATRGSFCSFMVLRRGGVDVPVLNILEARTKFLLLAALVQVHADRYGLDAWFLTRPNQAAVLGTVLSDQESTTFSNVELGSDLTAIVAVGDSRATDLDLYLTEGSSRKVAEHTTPEAEALIMYQPSLGRNYSIRVANASGNGEDSFVMFGILPITQ